MKTDSPHILCINPWIHDFAAFDFWARPMGLLLLAAIMRKGGLRVSFIDCLERFHPNEEMKAIVRRDGRGPYKKTQIPLPKGLEGVRRKFSRYGILPGWFRQDLREIEKPDLVFVTSMMTYWASGVQETIAAVKSVYPDVPVVLGGVYASLCHEHARQNSGADLVVNGAGETLIAGIVEKFTHFSIDVPDTQTHLDDLPYPAFDLMREQPYIPLLTSRGCPFSCEYCASSFLEPQLKRRSPDRVFKEIEFWHHDHGVENFAFYDDALLVDPDHHAFVLFEKMITSKLAVSFHTPNALHVRAVTPKAAGLMFKAGFKTIRLGLETANFGTDRSFDVKVAKNDFDQAASSLKSAGFSRDQVGAYLLCGLPGQDLDDVEKSIRFVKQAGIQPVLAYYTPIPHTPMWETACRHAKYDLSEHPVFTNNTLFPCVLSPDDLMRISQLKNLTR